MLVNNEKQGSLGWHQLRQGIITGTSLKSALGTPKTQTTLLYELVAERMTEPSIDDFYSKQVERGKEMEPVARRAVIEKTGVDFIECGMLFDDSLPGFGFSPDSIYMADGVVVGGLEIKCPASKNHIKYMIEGGVPKEYEYQVLAPFLLSDEVKWWMFASFDDRNYEKPVSVYTMMRPENDIIEGHRIKLRAFIERVGVVHAQLSF